MPVGAIIKQKVLDAITADSNHTNDTLAKACGVTTRAVRYAIKELCEAGKLQRVSRLRVELAPITGAQETVADGQAV